MVDTLSMSGGSPREALETELHSLLEKHPEALVTALGDDGFRIPMPNSLASPEIGRSPFPPTGRQWWTSSCPPTGWRSSPPGSGRARPVWHWAPSGCRARPSDQLGHAIGDEVLVHAACSIRGLLRGDDIVGRIGGDEFLVLSQRLDDSAQAMAIANRIAEALHQRVALSSGGFDLRASIGVAFSEEAETADVLVERADAAMYESKRQGLGHPVAFDDLALRS